MQLKKFLVSHKTHIFIILLAILTIRVIVPQLSDLRDSIAALSTANLYWIALGILVFFLSVPLGTLQMTALALKPISFGQTFRVQTAVLFVSKLLPQSVGAISLNVYYLMKKGHTASQSATMMTIDGITNGIVYTIMMIVGILISPLSLDGLINQIELSANLLLFLLIILVGIIFIARRSTKIRDRVKKAWAELRSNFVSYRDKKLPVILTGIYNGLSSLTSIFALWASAQAIGIELSFSAALLAYTFGNIAATLIPTPGGIGAVEAGIYSGLVLTGVSGPDATLITLIYRLITYWIPFIPGYYAFWSLRKNLLANYKVRKHSS